MSKFKTFLDWIAAQESSATTRGQAASALGLAPPRVDAFSHSSSPPWVMKKLLKQAKQQKQVSDEKRKGKPIWQIPEEARRPDYSFDQWLNKAKQVKDDMDKAEKEGQEEEDKLEKQKKPSKPEQDKTDKLEKPEQDADKGLKWNLKQSKDKSEPKEPKNLQPKKNPENPKDQNGKDS